MVNIYEDLRDDNGNLIIGRTRLFIKTVDDSNGVELYQSGTSYTPEGNGTQFIVDDWLIKQIDRVQFKDGTLSVKDGEELIPPVKSELELEEEELLRRIAEIQAQKQANTEEQTDAPLLDYTDEPTE